MVGPVECVFPTFAYDMGRGASTTKTIRSGSRPDCLGNICRNASVARRASATRSVSSTVDSLPPQDTLPRKWLEIVSMEVRVPA